MGISGAFSRLFDRSSTPPADAGSAVLDKRPSGAFLKGRSSPFFAGPRPALRDAKEEVRLVWTEAAARAVDAAHNSGWIAGGVDRATEITVGTGLTLKLKPDVDSLGGDAATWNAWARMVEGRFSAYASSPIECDASGGRTLGQMSAAILKSWFGTGDGLATLEWLARPGAISKSKVWLHPSHRLVQESDPSLRLYQGVWLDPFGFPLGYRMRREDPALPLYAGPAVDLQARDRAGRLKVIHIFDGAIGQVRGITPLVPVLRVMKQFDQLQDATTTSSLIQAIFAATIQGDGPTEHLLRALQDEGEQGLETNVDGYFEARDGWYDGTKIDLGAFGKIAHLFPGEKLEFHAGAGPQAAYEAFAKFLLRECSRIFGLTFEDFTGDYSGATYSSVRMATAINWLTVVYRRVNLIARFNQPVFEAWLEEEIFAGRIEFPGGPEAFLRLKLYACRAEWRGHAKPQADDLKAAKALETLQRMGIASDEFLANELGLDIQDVYEARAREADERKRLGLRDPIPADPMLGHNGGPPLTGAGDGDEEDDETKQIGKGGKDG